jgi:hypothetical protein
VRVTTPESDTESDQLLRLVRQAAEGTPYAVRETDEGFDVSLDLDARWSGTLRKEGLRTTCIHHVSFPGPGTYSVTDDVREIDWEAGVARLAAHGSRTTGRVREKGFEKTYVFDRRTFRFRQVSAQSFDTGQGRRLIDAAAVGLGLRAKRSGAEVIGIVMASIAALGALITVVTLIIGVLLGWFS